jgi:Cytochrome P460
MKMPLRLTMFSGLLIVGMGASAAPFGDKEDVQYAAKLWKALEKAHFVGKHAIYSTPYTGKHPHGAILDAIDGELKVSGNIGAVIVKRNYGGDGASKQSVANDPTKYLKAVTVMYKRKGYDPEDGDWFWTKYNPDGTLAKSPEGMQLAGRVAKGATEGCIACHRAAPGGDFVFNNDRIK